MFAIEPKQGWKPGDRAYCIRGTRETVPTLEAGKVYEVDEVVEMPAHVNCGLSLKGFTLPDGSKGLWSGRFVWMPAVRALDFITRSATPVMMDAYKANSKAWQKR